MNRDPRRMRELWMVGIALTAGALQAFALGRRAPLADATVASWTVYWEAARSRQVLEAQAPHLEEVAVFAYHFDERRRLIPAAPEVVEVLEALRAMPRHRRPRTLVTVVNDVVAGGAPPRLKDPQCVHEALASPEATAAHVDQLLQAAAGADGLELDYENLLAADRDAFTRLVRTLAARLHAHGQWLSVVVQPKTDHRIRDGAGAMDWAAIARHADRIKIMAYHYHHAGGRPGPVAPPEWVDALARFALTQIPQDKLCLALTLYGFDWGEGQAGRSIGYEEAMRIATAHRAGWRRDPKTGSPHFSYDAGGVRHEVWYEDGESLRRKLARARRAGVASIGLWHLGAGDALIGDALRAAQQPSG